MFSEPIAVEKMKMALKFQFFVFIKSKFVLRILQVNPKYANNIISSALIILSKLPTLYLCLSIMVLHGTVSVHGNYLNNTYITNIYIILQYKKNIAYKNVSTVLAVVLILI